MKFELINIGKGTYGAGGTQLLAENLYRIDSKGSSVNSDDFVTEEELIAEVTASITAYDTEIKAGVVAAGDNFLKLYSLIQAGFNQITVSDIAARDALNITTLPTNVFVENAGDGNWALYTATTPGINATYVLLSDPDSLNAVMSAATIKAAYESNANTNAFTDALLAKLTDLPEATASNRFQSVFLVDEADNINAELTTTEDGCFVVKSKTGVTMLELDGEGATLEFIRLLDNNTVTSIEENEVINLPLDITISDNAALISISAPLLETIGGDFFIYNNDSLTSISVILLETIGGSFFISENNNLSSIFVPCLTTTIDSGFEVGNNETLTTISAPQLTMVGTSFKVYNNSALTTISVPHLTTMPNGLEISQNNLLTTISFPNLVIQNSQSHNLSENAFSEITVDYLLNLMDISDTINGSLQLQGGGNSSPSTAGLTSKANLVAKGWTITHN